MTITTTRSEKAARKARLLMPVALALVLSSAGCSHPGTSPRHFNGTEVTGAAFATDFQLTDHTGHSRRLADFRGQVVAVFFGYTHCPDACPTALGELAMIAKRLDDDDARRLQVLFVTLDPQRDTQEVLSRYVPAFDPRFLGLYGDGNATKQVTSAFKVYWARVPGKTPAGYTIDHSVYTYVFDTRGKLRLLIPPTEPAGQKLKDLRVLLAGG